MQQVFRKIVCNQCGREMRQQQGMLQEGAFRAEVKWGFFSGKDGENHSFCLCEACYDRLLAGFVIPAEIEERTELL